ncbi:MAG: DNA-packaging protein [Mogibacterium sp.]|nr:DNA-packaging protein [Mogibacterium sp.]
MSTLDKVKQALRIKTDAYNDELMDLVAAAEQDLGVAGVIIPQKSQEIVLRAVITYCKMSFGLPEDYDRLKRSYDEQKAQLSNATGFTDWQVRR